MPCLETITNTEATNFTEITSAGGKNITLFRNIMYRQFQERS